MLLFLILDAFDPRRLDPHLTPTLWNWANRDGAVAGVGEAVMASCTYPNHASFITGVEPDTHGIFANHVVREEKVKGAWEVGPTVPTLFDRFGAEAVAVLGDHHLVGVMGARAASSHWPPNGSIPDDCLLDPLGYPDDESVLPLLTKGLEERPRLVVGYFGSIDTYSHVYGPDSAEALDAYRRVDAKIAAIEEALNWEETAVFVVSDHVQDTAEDRPGIDLRSVLGDDVTVVDEGSASLCGPIADHSLLNLDGVEGWRELPDGNTLVWCERGRYFGPFEEPILRGVHGGANTRTQLALVTGGDPLRLEAARQVAAGPVPASKWASLIESAI